MVAYETLEQCTARKKYALDKAAQVAEHHTHHLTLTRPFAVKSGDRDIKVTADRKESKVTQAYVNEIAAHVRMVEADPVYSAPQPFKRWPS